MTNDVFIFFFKQKTAYEMRISDWSSDVCSSDLGRRVAVVVGRDDDTADDRRNGENSDDPARTAFEAILLRNGRGRARTVERGRGSNRRRNHRGRGERDRRFGEQIHHFLHPLVLYIFSTRPEDVSPPVFGIDVF